MPEFPEATKTKSSDCCSASFISPHILPFLPKAAVLSLPCLDSVKGFKTFKGLLFKENRLEHARKQPFTFRSYNKFRLAETSQQSYQKVESTAPKLCLQELEANFSLDLLQVGDFGFSFSVPKRSLNRGLKGFLINSNLVVLKAYHNFKLHPVIQTNQCCNKGQGQHLSKQHNCGALRTLVER